MGRSKGYPIRRRHTSFSKEYACGRKIARNKYGVSWEEVKAQGEYGKEPSCKCVFNPIFRFLGFALGRNRKGAYIRVHAKSKKKAKDKLRKLTSRSQGRLRRRIRMYIWKQWKTPKTRVANLKKLGMPEWHAYWNGNTRKGYWAIAGSGILHHTITNERLARRGYYDIYEAYKSMHLIWLNRRVPNGTHGGVRGRLLN